MNAVTDEQAFRLYRILAAYERDLSEEDVQVMKLISTLRVPVDMDTVAGTFSVAAARSPVDPRASGPGVQSASSPPGEFRLRQCVSRLAELQMLESHAVPPPPRYSAHPLVGLYFSRAAEEDSLALHQDAATYLQRKLAAGQVRVRTRGPAVRTRGAVRSLERGREDMVTEPVVLDMYEEPELSRSARSNSSTRGSSRARPGNRSADSRAVGPARPVS